MTKPVQIKICFGMMMISKRTYLTLSIIGFVVLLGIWVLFETVLGPGTSWGIHLRTAAPWFFDYLPWIILVGAVMESIEMAFILKKFRHREDFLARQRSDSKSLNENAAAD